MQAKFKPNQHVYFLISGRHIKEATVVAVSSWFITIKFKKTEDCIIRLSYNRIFRSKEEAEEHILPELPPAPVVLPSLAENGEYICHRNWELWE